MDLENRPTPDLKLIIDRSLERSKHYGIDPNLPGAPESSRLTNEQLAERISSVEGFYNIAKFQLETLFKLLKGTGFCMAMADSRGYVLYVNGDLGLTEHFKRRRCIPGYRWTEQDVGTCAIGLVLVERIPIFLPGEKMFSTKAKIVSNAAAPVFSHDGKDFLGVIILCGYSEKMHIHTLGLARQAAETITMQLRLHEQMRELDIQHQYMVALLDSNSNGMITLDQHGCIVKANRTARALMNLPSDVDNKSFTEYVGEGVDVTKYIQQGKGFRARDFSIKNDETIHFASMDPIHLSNGELVGGLITIIEKKEIIRVASEMSGSLAHFTFGSITGTSEKLYSAIRLARIAAKSNTPVFLSGETGTGKELFAQAIHNESGRNTQPFVAINCGAIPKELLESELFGYEEGAFTGAQKGGRRGKLELADNGTLFLDEIGDMPFDMQVKLLRVLQSGEIQRIGSLRTIHVNFRIISATNQDLKNAVKNQQFREDLYYRICSFKINIPPLRERDRDVLLLAEHFLNRHALNTNRNLRFKNPEIENALLVYHWPGNIRQLESAIERAVQLAERGEIMPEHLGISDITQAQIKPTCSPRGISTLAEIEKEALTKTLEHFNGNICKTAKALGISRPTIYRKLEKFQLS